jgi:hypothetical protein
MFWLNCFRFKSSHISQRDDYVRHFHRTLNWRNVFTIFDSCTNISISFSIAVIISMVLLSRVLTNIIFLSLSDPPQWPCGSSCRGGVTRKDACWFKYFSFIQSCLNRKYHNIFSPSAVMTKYCSEFHKTFPNRSVRSAYATLEWRRH